MFARTEREDLRLLLNSSRRCTCDLWWLENGLVALHANEALRAARKFWAVSWGRGAGLCQEAWGVRPRLCRLLLTARVEWTASVTVSDGRRHTDTPRLVKSLQWQGTHRTTTLMLPPDMIGCPGYASRQNG